MPNDFDESAASVRRRLGERAWFEAYEAGKGLNSEQAMRLADVADLPWKRRFSAGRQA